MKPMKMGFLGRIPAGNSHTPSEHQFKKGREILDKLEADDASRKPRVSSKKKRVATWLDLDQFFK
jgi:hypothetical protein